MEKILFSIGFHGKGNEWPERPKAGNRISLIEFDIEHLSRCCMSLLQRMDALEAEVERLRKKL